MFRGDSGDDFFKSSERSDLSYVGHLRGYQDLSESTNIDLGVLVLATGTTRRASSATWTSAGSRRSCSASTPRCGGSRCSARSITRSSPAARSSGAAAISPAACRPRIGFYVSGDYQLGRRWFTGVRFDRSDRADDAAVADTGQSLLLTYWPSEFSQVRGQYRRTAYGDGPTANEFLFQFQFSIGAHGAHPF